jgi:hypothetical protein
MRADGTQMEPQVIAEQLARERFKRQLDVMPADELCQVCERVAKNCDEAEEQFKRRLMTEYHFSTRQRREVAHKRARLSAEIISFYGPRRQAQSSQVRGEPKPEFIGNVEANSHGNIDLIRGHDPWQKIITTAAA